MRPHEFLNRLVGRFSEMDESELKDLHADATADYKERLAQAQSKLISNLERLKEVDAKANNKDAREPRKLEVLNPIDKMILKGEHWVTRYAFAVSYILAVPIVRGYMNEEGEGEESSQDMEFLKLFTAYQKMRKA